MKTSYIARSPMVAARELGGEMVIMSAVDSSLFSLNEVASLIWRSADGTTPLQRIVQEKVCAEFDVDPTIAFSDAERLVSELAQHGLLMITDHPLNSLAGLSEQTA